MMLLPSAPRFEGSPWNTCRINSTGSSMFHAPAGASTWNLVRCRGVILHQASTDDFLRTSDRPAAYRLQPGVDDLSDLGFYSSSHLVLDVIRRQASMLPSDRVQTHLFSESSLPPRTMMLEDLWALRTDLLHAGFVLPLQLLQVSLASQLSYSRNGDDARSPLSGIPVGRHHLLSQHGASARGNYAGKIQHGADPRLRSNAGTLDDVATTSEVLVRFRITCSPLLGVAAMDTTRRET